MRAHGPCNHFSAFPFCPVSQSTGLFSLPDPEALGWEHKGLLEVGKSPALWLLPLRVRLLSLTFFFFCTDPSG